MKNKIVYESLNEMNFQKKMDNPLGALRIGQKQLITQWLDEMGVEGYTINDDLTIDVKKHVNLFRKNIKKIPDFIQFNRVNGSFWIGGNRLITLRGCPTYVKDCFGCSENDLVSLRGCPKYVGEQFGCFKNKKQFTEEYVRSLCDVKGDVYVYNK